MDGTLSMRTGETENRQIQKKPEAACRCTPMGNGTMIRAVAGTTCRANTLKVRYMSKNIADRKLS